MQYTGGIAVSYNANRQHTEVVASTQSAGGMLRSAPRASTDVPSPFSLAVAVTGSEHTASRLGRLGADGRLGVLRWVVSWGFPRLCRV